MRLIDADALPKYTGYALSADEVAMAVENAPTIKEDDIVKEYCYRRNLICIAKEYFEYIAHRANQNVVWREENEAD